MMDGRPANTPEIMPMSTAALRKQLERLLGELARAKTLDPDARDAVKDVVAEIERTLVETEPDVRSVRERVESTALGFEAEHPRLAAVLGEITDTLAKLGI
jgi:Cft2 family RNA processing exonuclease